MVKRTLFSSFFFIAFAVSLVHSSLPHSHPDLEGSRVAETNSHNKESHRHDHDHQHAGHEHGSSDHNQSSLPVFAHFSNVDFIRTSQYEFSGKERFVISSHEPVRISINVPECIEIRSFFPKPREHPAGPLGSVRSLRAPPFAS